MTEVGPQRSEAGSTTDPIAPTEPAVGMCAERRLVTEEHETKPPSGVFFARHRTRSANNETTTTARHPELRDPRPDPTDDRSRKLARSLVEWH